MLIDVKISDISSFVKGFIVKSRFIYEVYRNSKVRGSILAPKSPYSPPCDDKIEVGAAIPPEWLLRFLI
jgi:hypothetical protein